MRAKAPSGRSADMSQSGDELAEQVGRLEVELAEQKRLIEELQRLSPRWLLRHRNWAASAVREAHASRPDDLPARARRAFATCDIGSIPARVRMRATSRVQLDNVSRNGKRAYSETTFPRGESRVMLASTWNDRLSIDEVARYAVSTGLLVVEPLSEGEARKMAEQEWWETESFKRPPLPSLKKTSAAK